MKKIISLLSIGILFISFSNVNAARSVLSFQFPTAEIQQEILTILKSSIPVPEVVPALQPFVKSLSIDALQVGSSKQITVSGGNFDLKTVFSFSEGLTIKKINIVSSSVAVLDVVAGNEAIKSDLSVKNGEAEHFGGDFFVNIVDKIILVPAVNVAWSDILAMSAGAGVFYPTVQTNAWTKGVAFGDLSATQDFKLSFRPRYMVYGPQENGSVMIGFSNDNPDFGYKSIDYAIYLKDGSELLIYENGVNKGSFGNFEMSDRFEIERVGTVITYLKNGVVFYTSSVPSSKSLMFDASVYRYLGAQDIQIELN